MLLIVDLSTDLDCATYLKRGWSIPESEFVWSCEEVSELQIPHLGVAGIYNFVFEFRPFAPAGSPFRQVQIAANETPVLEVALSETREVTFSVLHDPQIHAGINLRFRHLNPGRPTDFSPDTDDNRLLSLALRRFEVRLIEPMPTCHGGLAESDNLLFSEPARREAFRTQRFAELGRDLHAFTEGRGDAISTHTHILRFLQGAAAGAFHIRRDFAHYIARRIAAETRGNAGTGEVFESGSFLKPDVVRRLAPSYAELAFSIAPAVGTDQEEILAAGSRAGASTRLPPPINQFLWRPLRPAVHLYSVRNAIVHASADEFQLYDGTGENAWLEMSPFGLPRSIMLAPWRQVDGHIVIVRDRFSGANFAHFLFDFMTRVKHFCAARPELIDRSTFLLGGVPTPFHDLILSAFQRLYPVRREQLLFPGNRMNLRATEKIYWFSDATEEQMLHPAQLMHPESVALFRALGNEIDCADGDCDRIYISRGDVGTRALSNEADLIPRLERYGFKVVRLGALPVLEQVRVVRGARAIVAPHGMGLTHLALHRGSPTLIELFNPTLASDAYACLAAALGCPYAFVIGTETDPGSRGFSVDVEAVEDVLRNHGIN